MGFPQRIDDEKFLRMLDEADDEWIAEQQAQREQEGHDHKPDPTDEDIASREEAERFWRRPDVREILEQWDPYADIAHREPDGQK